MQWLSASQVAVAVLTQPHARCVASAYQLDQQVVCSTSHISGAQPVSSGAAGVTGTGTNGGLLSRVFGGSSDEEAAAAAAAASMNTGDPAAATEEEQSDLDEAKGEFDL